MMREEFLPVTRTARYATLGSKGANQEQVWFVLHGYGQLAGPFLRHFDALDDGTRFLVAPEGLSRFYIDPEPGRGAPTTRVGASWMTREDRLNEIDDYVRYLDAVAARVLADWVGAGPRVVVLGFSQGVATAARWVTRGSVAVRRLVLWAGGLPPDLDLARLRAALVNGALTLVVGSRDPLISGAARASEERRLRDSGIPYQLRAFDGGHELDRELLVELAHMV